MSTTRQPRFFEMNRYTSVIQSADAKNKDKKKASGGGAESKGPCHPDGLLCNLFFCFKWCAS